MEYSVEELARAAGVAVDTVRFYQARGLLKPPRRVGRRAVYDDSHRAALKRIKRHQAEGLPLAVVKKVMTGGGSKRAALLAAVADEDGGATLTRAELAAQSGVPEPLLASLEAAGLLVPVQVDGEPRYGDGDLRMARAGLEVLGAGFPLPELMQLALRHASHVESIADDAVALFDRFVRKVDGGGADPEAIAATFRRVMPAVTTLVAQHFQRTVLRRALERLREHPDAEALQQAVQVIESGRLEVSWR
ncbi:MAG: MerR family transcriptional regulator [Deltaproteobacteria bacterium]|nr:MerR family transcriptional regulator [Deltaproteobacteria bacterium]